MASRQPIQIHDRVFPTKKAATQYIQEMMSTYEDDRPLGEADKAFVLALVKRHRLGEQKVESGISQIVIKTVPPFGTRSFYFIKNNGIPVPVSFIECLTRTSQLQRFKLACREAVHDQIEVFVREAFATADTVSCAITGLPTSRKSCQVDHEPPFRELVDRFLQETGIDVEQVAIGGDADHETRDYFEDHELRRSFAEFHRMHARLRITSRDANLRRRRKRP